MRTHYTTARSLIIFSFRHSFLDEIIPGVLTASRNRLGVQLQQPATLDNRFTVPVAFLSLTVDQLSLEISVAFFTGSPCHLAGLDPRAQPRPVQLFF